jgi:hypothetical protein
MKTGGPAFPSTLQYFPDDTSYHDHQGMTLRDYFAAKAMQSLLASIESGNEHQVPLIPNIAYEIADAMLREALPLHPPRKWVGLTEAERIDIIDEEITAQSTEHFALAQAIEAKLRGKNT